MRGGASLPERVLGGRGTDAFAVRRRDERAVAKRPDVIRSFNLKEPVDPDAAVLPLRQFKLLDDRMGRGRDGRDDCLGRYLLAIRQNGFFASSSIEPTVQANVDAAFL